MIPIPFLIFSLELIPSAFWFISLPRESSCQRRNTPMLLNPLTLYLPCIWHSCHCILSDTPSSVVFQDTTFLWFMSSLNAHSSLSPLLLPIFHPDFFTLGAQVSVLRLHLLPCLPLISCLDTIHILMVHTISSPFQTSVLNFRLKYAAISWNLHLAIEELFQNLMYSKWTDPYPRPLKLNSQILPLSVVGNFLLPVGQAQTFGFVFTYHTLHQAV